MAGGSTDARPLAAWDTWLDAVADRPDRRRPPGVQVARPATEFGYLIPDELAWQALERQIEEGGWTVRTRSNIPGFFRGCYIEVLELGHFLEFILPGPGLLERMNATPAS